MRVCVVFMLSACGMSMWVCFCGGWGISVGAYWCFGVGWWVHMGILGVDVCRGVYICVGCVCVCACVWGVVLDCWWGPDPCVPLSSLTEMNCSRIAWNNYTCAGTKCNILMMRTRIVYVPLLMLYHLPFRLYISFSNVYI